MTPSQALIALEGAISRFETDHDRRPAWIIIPPGFPLARLTAEAPFKKEWTETKTIFGAAVKQGFGPLRAEHPRIVDWNNEQIAFCPVDEDTLRVRASFDAVTWRDVEAHDGDPLEVPRRGGLTVNIPAATPPGFVAPANTSPPYFTVSLYIPQGLR